MHRILAAILIVAVLAVVGCGQRKKASASQTGQAKPEVHVDKWWEGGTLNNATIGEWKAATYKNKLATAADWLAATKWKNGMNTMEDIDRLKVKARVLVVAIDDAIDVDDKGELSTMNINEIGAAIITLSNDLGPY